MSPICIVTNCDSPTSGRSNKCNAHRLAHRRHGHPLQTGLKATEYGPYRDAIRRIWEANEASPLWEVIRARWGRCVGHAQAALGQRDSGVPSQRHAVRAAEEVLKMDRNVPFISLACTSLAMYVLQSDHPRRFRDDEAFRFQLVRKVRGLDALAVYKTWNHKRRASHWVYRDMPPRAVRVMADYLAAAFGEAGLLLRDHAKTRPRLEVTELQLMADAVGALQ